MSVIRVTIDHVIFVYREVTLYILMHFLTGKILHRLHGKIYILCHNFHINSKFTKATAVQLLKCLPFLHIKSWEKSDSAISIKHKICCILPLSCVQMCLQEVQALWLFCKHVMSQVTSSIDLMHWHHPAAILVEKRWRNNRNAQICTRGAQDWPMNNLLLTSRWGRPTEMTSCA